MYIKQQAILKEQLHYYHKVKESEINGTKHKNNTVDRGIYNASAHYTTNTDQPVNGRRTIFYSVGCDYVMANRNNDCYGNSRNLIRCV